MSIQAAEQVVSEKTCTERTCKKKSFLQFTPTRVCFHYSDGCSNLLSISPSSQDISLCSESLPKCFGVLLEKKPYFGCIFIPHLRLLHPNADPTLLCLCLSFLEGYSMARDVLQNDQTCKRRRSGGSSRSPADNAGVFPDALSL